MANLKACIHVCSTIWYCHKAKKHKLACHLVYLTYCAQRRLGNVCIINCKYMWRKIVRWAFRSLQMGQTFAQWIEWTDCMKLVMSQMSWFDGWGKTLGKALWNIALQRKKNRANGIENIRKHMGLKTHLRTMFWSSIHWSLMFLPCSRLHLLGLLGTCDVGLPE